MAVKLTWRVICLLIVAVSISCGTRPERGDANDNRESLIEQVDGARVDAPGGTPFVRANRDETALAYLSRGVQRETIIILVDGGGQRRVSPPGLDIESFDWDPAQSCGWIVAIHNSETEDSALARLSCTGTISEVAAELPSGTGTRGLAVVGDDAIVVALRTAGPYETASHLVELTLSTGVSRVLTSGDTVADSGPVAVPTRQSVVFTRGVVDEQAATIGVLGLTTNAITWLTDESRLSSQPSVSRDGSTVVFDSFTPRGNDRATWAVSILGGEATLVDETGNGHPVVVGSSVLLQSDGVFRAVPLP